MSRQSDYMKMKLAESTLHPNRYSEVDLMSTQGRIGGKLYFLYSSIIPLLILGMFVGIAAIMPQFSKLATVSVYALLAFASIAGLYSMVRLTIQRCNDFNGNTWLSILAIIPFVNIIFALIPGNNGLNQFGEVPQPGSALANIAIVFLVCVLIALAAYFVLGFNFLQIAA